MKHKIEEKMTDKIITQCKHCSKRYSLNAGKFAGKRIKCPNCGQPIRVASNPEPETNAKTKPAPAQPQQRQPQPPVPQAQSTAPAPSSTARPSKSWKKKALAAVAALVLILVYTYWTELRAWYVEAEAGEPKRFSIQKTDTTEKELSEQMINHLDLNSEERKEIDAIITSFVSGRGIKTKHWPEISKEQERSINSLQKYGFRQITWWLKKNKDMPEKELYRQMAEKDYIYALFLGYQWSGQERYRKLWIKSALQTLLKNHPGSTILRKSMKENLYDLFFVYGNSINRSPGAKALFSYLYKDAIKKAVKVKTRAQAMACLSDLNTFRKSDKASALIKACIKRILDPTIPMGNLGEWTSAYQSLIEYIQMEQRENRIVEPSLLKEAHRFSQYIAILLEPDGCLPQIDGVKKRICLREPLFYAAQLFDRDDFRFIAYGGIRMSNARPPSALSVYLPELEKCIMRSSWNINYHKNKVVDKWLGDDQASMIIDLKTGEMSFYGYTHPQCVVKNTRFAAADPEGVVWKSDKTRDYLSFKTELGKTEIYFIKSMKTWIIRDDFSNTKILPEQEIQFYRSHTAEFDKNSIFSEHVERVCAAVRHTTMINRQPGNVFIQSDQTPFTSSKIKPKREGCYYKTVRKLAQKNEMLVTAIPFIRPDKLNKNLSSKFYRIAINFNFLKKCGRNTYRAWKIHRNRYKKLVYEKENMSDSEAGKEIQLSETEVIINNLKRKLTQN